MEFREKLVMVRDAGVASQTLPEDFDAEVAVKEEAARKAGFDAGVASVSSPGDKIFSQEDMDAAVKAAQDAGDAKVASAVSEAKSQLIVDIEADLQAAQDSENATEQEFKMKLEGRKNF